MWSAPMNPSGPKFWWAMTGWRARSDLPTTSLAGRQGNNPVSKTNSGRDHYESSRQKDHFRLLRPRHDREQLHRSGADRAAGQVARECAAESRKGRREGDDHPSHYRRRYFSGTRRTTDAGRPPDIQLRAGRGRAHFSIRLLGDEL